MSEQARCELCGEPMPPGEEMFRYHSGGPCPKPPLPQKACPHTWTDGVNKAWGCVLPAGHDGPHKQNVAELQGQ